MRGRHIILEFPGRNPPLPPSLAGPQKFLETYLSFSSLLWRRFSPINRRLPNLNLPPILSCVPVCSQASSPPSRSLGRRVGTSDKCLCGGACGGARCPGILPFLPHSVPIARLRPLPSKLLRPIPPGTRTMQEVTFLLSPTLVRAEGSRLNLPRPAVRLPPLRGFPGPAVRIPATSPICRRNLLALQISLVGNAGNPSAVHVWLRLPPALLFDSCNVESANESKIAFRWGSCV